MSPTRAHASAAVALAALGLAGCGGGAPLLHPAHVLPAGFVDFAAGMSARAVVAGAQTTGNALSLQRASVAPGVSPVVTARVGVAGDHEVGLGYYGRSVRLDARHAFQDGGRALSIGLGASFILPNRPTGSDAVDDVYGGGADLPILLGVRSSSDLYALWIGARGGFELLRGDLPGLGRGNDAGAGTSPFSGDHVYGGGVLGMRAGFRHVHVAIELDAAYHYASGTIGASALSIQGFALTPAGAIVASF